MDQVQLGVIFRVVRLRRRWRQEDVARRARVSRSTVARIEQGRAGSVALGTVESVAAALEIQLRIVSRWHGSEADRLVDAGHAAMHEAMARSFASKPGWEAVPEVSFALSGERGVIDVLAWHDASRALLIIELKTLLVEISDLIGAMDRRRRLGLRIAAERGWRPSAVSSWVVVGDTMTNRRRVADHEAVLRSAFPIRGVEMRRWLERPSGPVAALTFLSYDRQGRGRYRGPAASPASDSFSNASVMVIGWWIGVRAWPTLLGWSYENAGAGQSVRLEPGSPFAPRTSREGDQPRTRTTHPPRSAER